MKIFSFGPFSAPHKSRISLDRADAASISRVWGCESPPWSEGGRKAWEGRIWFRTKQAESDVEVPKQCKRC